MLVQHYPLGHWNCLVDLPRSAMSTAAEITKWNFDKQTNIIYNQENCDIGPLVSFNTQISVNVCYFRFHISIFPMTMLGILHNWSFKAALNARIYIIIDIIQHSAKCDGI